MWKSKFSGAFVLNHRVVLHAIDALHPTHRLTSTQVSTTHAKIELKNDQIVLVDVGSTNGTSVDGEPIEEGKPHPLAAGNTVVFGASTFTVSEIKAA